MTTPNTLFAELKQLKDELTLQAHLLEMEAKSEWDSLLGRFHKLESQLAISLVNTAKQIGESEREEYVGDEQEIKQLLREFNSIKTKHKF